MDHTDQTLFERLVAECAERLDREGCDALDELCARHPQHADALRRVMAPLMDFGVAGPTVATPALPFGSGVPREFGDYLVEHEIGRGGMGIVFAARQRSLDRRVALKVLSRPLLPHSRAQTRFQREARLLARLEHRGIVRVLDAGAIGDVPYYVMDLVDGAPFVGGDRRGAAARAAHRHRGNRVGRRDRHAAGRRDRRARPTGCGRLAPAGLRGGLRRHLRPGRRRPRLRPCRGRGAPRRQAEQRAPGPRRRRRADRLRLGAAGRRRLHDPHR